MAMNQANRDYKPALNLLIPLFLFLLVVLGYILGEFFDGLVFKMWLLPVGVFYWALFTPTATPIILALTLALLEDGLAGTPFGLHGLAILGVHYMALSQRQSLIYSPFAMIVTGFAINMAVVMAAMSGVMWLLELPVNLWVIVSWLFVVVAFILLAKWFEMVRHKLMKD